MWSCLWSQATLRGQPDPFLPMTFSVTQGFIVILFLTRPLLTTCMPPLILAWTSAATSYVACPLIIPSLVS